VTENQGRSGRISTTVDGLSNSANRHLVIEANKKNGIPSAGFLTTSSSSCFY